MIFCPLSRPTFPPSSFCLCKTVPIYLSVVHPSFLLSISLLILSLFYCCCTYWASSPSLLMSIAASFYFLSFRHQCVHSSIHHSMRTKPLSNTDRQTPSLSYFPYKLFPTTKNEKLSLSLSILYHTNPPLTASTHISTHFWLWASDTHLFVSLHKSLKDPQMCAPLISISKKNHLPPSIIHLSVHPRRQTHYYTQLINDKPFLKKQRKRKSCQWKISDLWKGSTGMLQIQTYMFMLTITNTIYP